jgi:hypothetical protein
MVLDFGVLAVAMQVVTTFLKHAGM